MNRQCKGFVELWVGLYLTLKSQQHICGEKKKQRTKENTLLLFRFNPNHMSL